jgi:hypothetical protein
MEHIDMEGTRQGVRTPFCNRPAFQRPLWVKTRKTRFEHMFSALPQLRTFVGCAGVSNMEPFVFGAELAPG